MPPTLHVMAFSLRRDAEGLTLAQVVEEVSAALGCSLAMSYEERYGTDVFEGECLGMRLVIGEWRGIGRTRTFQLHGETRGRPEGAELVVVPIDGPVIDLLSRRSAGAWRVPSEAELEAESDYEAERDDH